MKSYISHISYYLPEQTLTNADLCKLFPNTTEEDIFERSGIKTRHIALSEEDRSFGIPGSDLAYYSAIKLFDEYKIDPATVDFLLLCTEGLDYKAPATANILQDRLNLPKHSGAIDIPMGCTGFVNGLSVAKGLIESGQATKVLLLTAEVPSFVIHPDDLELRMLFGDGAAATLIEGHTGKEAKIGPFVFGSNGSGAKHMLVKSSGVREAIDEQWLHKYKNVDGMKHGIMEMNGREIFIFALKEVPAMVNTLLSKAGLEKDKIDLYIFHQANAFLLETLRKKLRIPKEKFFVYLEEVGNTVSASIPIALKEAINSGKAKKGDKIVLAGFGIGFAWAGTIITL
ncbi:MAG: ketoacyl-ACP synthase III [Bacteroidetes bacterium]|nr:ketoacyl-ACP synthase III [Bacteroidota bacterium]